MVGLQHIVAITCNAVSIDVGVVRGSVRQFYTLRGIPLQRNAGGHRMLQTSSEGPPMRATEIPTWQLGFIRRSTDNHTINLHRSPCGAACYPECVCLRARREKN